MTNKMDIAESQFHTDSPSKTADSQLLLDTITEGLLEKKARDIKILDVSSLTTLTDYFVVCHGNSETQIRALANSVIENVKEKLGENVWKKEGLDARRWIILDYVNVVVHIFSEEKREYYGIERMWNDAEITEVEDSE
ncbi:ribosome silencing factor [Rhodohalobacter sulfatireducens]|uniref:Ribosomal silencing factor RsfS n=1 Tax=Rhodohalobacter sulfatireducens TaxID=2911366 RepID=A0ABS9KGD7_9BACT|nr:ribosome silencing factor [Rhodohalobacter sulfatireducens]MCG2589915.1 ribosome silencing factor [Rhodohalobacter sulfatireducens]